MASKRKKTEPSREKRSGVRSSHGSGDGGNLNTAAIAQSILQHIQGSLPPGMSTMGPGGGRGGVGVSSASSMAGSMAAPAPVRLTVGVDTKLLQYLKQDNTLVFWQMVSRMSGVVLQELVTPTMLDASGVSYATWEEVTQYVARTESDKVNSFVNEEERMVPVDASLRVPTREAMRIALEYTGSGQYGIEQACAALRKDTRLFAKVEPSFQDTRRHPHLKTYAEIVRDLMTREELRAAFARLVALHVRLPGDMMASRRLKYNNAVDTDFQVIRDAVRELAHYFYSESTGELCYSASLLASPSARAIVDSICNTRSPCSRDSSGAPRTSFELSDTDIRRARLQERLGRKRVFPSIL